MSARIEVWVWVYFRRERGRYLTADNAEITISDLLAHGHEISHDHGRVLLPHSHRVLNAGGKAA